MSSTFTQPLSSLCPTESAPVAAENDPAKRDYLEGREQFKKGEYAMAAMAFHNALKGFEEQGDEAGVANAADRFGDVCLERQDYAAALAHYSRAYAICEKEEDSFSILALNKKMAAAHGKLGEFDQALEYAFDMVEHYQLTKDPKGMVETMTVIAELYQEKGDKLKAAETYRTIAAIHRNFKHQRMAEEFAARADELERA
ncbi:MAG: Tetratricopeptide repeat-containing protein [Candidatus Electronema aureum]|uniref:Tetratricopeptide repeat-containing protein n=1 Tax=Candidatus Electronema aureum TaxID=2005002 RepID=A0A521G3Z2_9BACT|nr:MAG: Tetratricopeptide repeat-containing protein [Candidatus Electronema aureum]